MRYGPLVAVLAISATAVSGCQTTVPDIDTSSATAANTGGGTTTFGGATGTGTTTTGSGDPTGSDTGTSTGQAVADGSTSYVFNDNGASTAGTAGTRITIANAGGAITSANPETASVAISTGNSAMTWADPIEMDLFSTTQAVIPGVRSLSGSYKEYREIDADTDAELQVWETTHTSVGQYAVWFDTSAPNNNNFANFFDGNETPEASMPTTATATYNGAFGAIAVASNWADGVRSIPDPFDTDVAVGDSWSPNGTWRVTGDSRITADFGAGTVTGSLTNSTWRKYTATPTSTLGDGYITIGTGEDRPFHDYTMNGTISGNSFSGTTKGPAGRVVTGDNALNGGFFGPNAEETAGVFRSLTTNPDPTDGVSPNDENRRGFIDIRGVFQGQ